MTTLIQDFKYGIRLLRANKGFTFVALIALALGIGANTAIFTIVNAVLLRPLPYPESERLMQIGRSFIADPSPTSLSSPKFVFVRDNLESFDAITATQGTDNLVLSDDSQTEYVNGLFVSADFFRVMGVHPAIGRDFTVDEDSPRGERVVILGDTLWRRRFGADRSVVGNNISLNGTSYSVIGIMPAGFEYFGQQDVLFPMRVDPASQNEGHNWTVIGRLKRGVTTEQASAEASSVYEKFRNAYPRQVDAKEYLGVTGLKQNITNDIRELLWLLVGAVGFVLLIACANVANLQLARASARQKEIGVRIALGASRWRVVRQLLTEGIVLALAGGLAGLLLAFWVLDALMTILPEGMIPRSEEINLDWRVLGFATAVSILTGVISGLAPALQTMRVDLNRAIKEGAGRVDQRIGRGRLRSVLMAAEVALALALTIGAGLLLRTFANLRGVEPGFDSAHLLTVDVAARGKTYDTPAKTNALYDRALEEFRSIPGVEDVALTNKLPLDRWFNLPYKFPGQTEWAGSTEYRLISHQYFNVMKISLLQGRAFDDRDYAGGEPVLIINDAFARRNFPQGDPLGQQVFIAGDDEKRPMRRVVGVVSATKQRGLIQSAPSAVFLPMEQATDGVKQIAQQASFVLRTSVDPLSLSGAVRSKLHDIDPVLPVRNIRAMDQLVSGSIAPQRFNLLLLGLFAGIGLLLAAVGIYGVVSYGVAQRTHEIGVRMALGADMRDVMKLVLGRGMGVVGAGIVIGLASAFALSRVMESLLFAVGARDFTTFAATAVLLAGVALGACFIPARRAAEVDPMVALRHE
jgi:putative ABC transport system permease protein